MVRKDKTTGSRVFLSMPFRIDPKTYPAASACLNQSFFWAVHSFENPYLYKFVFQNLLDPEHRYSSHYRWNSQSQSELSSWMQCDLCLQNTRSVRMEELDPNSEDGKAIDGQPDGAGLLFQIETICCSVFATGTGILTFVLFVDTDQPARLADFLSRIKKVSQVQFERKMPSDPAPRADDPNAPEPSFDFPAFAGADFPSALSFYQAARLCLDSSFGAPRHHQPAKEKKEKRERSKEKQPHEPVPIPYELFFYSPDQKEQANFLVYSCVESDAFSEENARRLQCCASVETKLPKPSLQDDSNLHLQTGNRLWAFSQEAVVLLETDVSIKKVASASSPASPLSSASAPALFEEQYFLLFLLTLHEKYTLLSLEMEMTFPNILDFEKLQDYRKRLLAFEAGYVFANLTDESEYQTVYEKIRQQNSLDQIYKEVHEPIESLGQLHMDAEQRRSDSLSKMVMFLTILTVFSTLNDAVTFAHQILAGEVGLNLAGLFVGIIVVITVLILTAAVPLMLKKGSKK